MTTAHRTLARAALDLLTDADIALLFIGVAYHLDTLRRDSAALIALYEEVTP